MDPEDWEILPQDGLFATNDDGRKIILTNSEIDMNYFVVNPSQITQELADQSENQLILKTGTPKTVGSDQDIVSQENLIFVHKEDEYPNFKDIDIHPRIDDDLFELMDKIKPYKVNIEGRIQVRPKNFFYQGQQDIVQHHARFQTLHLLRISTGKTASKKESKKENVSKKTNSNSGSKTDVACEEKSNGMNIWKLSLSGLGAVCLFGIATATFVVIVLASDGKNKHSRNKKEDDKVNQHAAKLDESITAETFPKHISYYHW